MKTILKHITNIQTGVFAKPIKEGEIVYLQAKHFDENGLLNRSDGYKLTLFDIK